MDLLNQAANHPSGPSSSILLVGGAGTDFDNLARILTASGWQLRHAADGVDAARLSSEQSFPVVICERDLPDGDWRALQAGLRNLEHPPLLVLTLAWGDEEAWVEALNLGAFDALARPFERAEVLRVLSMAMLAWTTSARQTGAAAGASLPRLAPTKQYSIHAADYFA